MDVGTSLHPGEKVYLVDLALEPHLNSGGCAGW